VFTNQIKNNFMPLEILDITKQDKKEVKENINFYISHLSVTELKILESVAKQLARSYSKSYNEWVSKD